MEMKVGVFMDPIENIDTENDTTFELLLTSQKKGNLNYYIDNLYLERDILFVKCRFLRLMERKPHFEFINKTEKMKADELDIVLMRKDPPFDMNYYFNCYLLTFCKKARVINNPYSLLKTPEKLYILHFPTVVPKTLVTSSYDDIEEFQESIDQNIVLKPIDGYAGRGVIVCSKEDRNIPSFFETLSKNETEKVVIQEYIPQITEGGDKRIIWINGEAVGTIARFPMLHDYRANMRVGGKAKLHTLTEKEQDLLRTVSSKMLEDEIYFAGIDIIGDFITEINVTSPTGMQSVRKLGGIDCADYFWNNL